MHMNNVCVQAINKIKAQHQEEINALVEKASGTSQVHAGGDADERLKAALLELAASKEQIVDLETQLKTATESLEKVKGDAKKYVESLKKKEQVMCSTSMMCMQCCVTLVPTLITH
jgi:hypothetical protein